MRVVEVERAPRGIDTRADYEAFVARRRSGARTDPRAAPARPAVPSRKE
jgi:hypothetical protein